MLQCDYRLLQRAIVSRKEFLSTEMTPRAVRMLSYCCIGFFVYGSVLLAEIYQNIQLQRIDQQLKMAEKMDLENDKETNP